MDKLREYRIAFRGLKDGKHVLNYTLDNSFFDCFDATKESGAVIETQVTITKTPLLLKLKIEENGTVRTVCDRCLGELDLKMEGEMELFVKVRERDSGNDDDYIVLAPDEDYLDISTFLYETYMLNYPIRAIHEEGECDEGMDDVLDGYIISENDKPTDPRWDELKKLINN